MKLISVSCSVDRKHRAAHTVKVLGEGTEDEMRVLMDKDVVGFMADELADNEDEEGRRVFSAAEIVELVKDPAGLKKAWEGDERWEMKWAADDKRLGCQRMFCGFYGDDGGWSYSLNLVV